MTIAKECSSKGSEGTPTITNLPAGGGAARGRRMLGESAAALAAAAADWHLLHCCWYGAGRVPAHARHGAVRCRQDVFQLLPNCSTQP